MKRLWFLIASLCANTVLAAELTRVASSLEEKDPFGMFLDATFTRTLDQAVLVREWYQDGFKDLTELKYQKVETQLGIDAHVGIYRDLELHIGVPIVFQQDRQWTFAPGTSDQNTTIYRNCVLDPAGTTCPTPAGGQGRLFEVPASSYRGGLGNLTFGLAWNVFVQKKDASKPTWTLRFDYTAPTASLLNPTAATSETKRGNIGDKIHRYTFSTALAKRLGPAEPYFSLSYTLPWRGPGAYSNCDDASPARLGHPENCGQGIWSRDATAINPSHTFGTIFGVELNVFEREDRHQRAAFDLRGTITYVSAGRYYNEASDLFGKLLATSDYGQVGAQLGFIGQAAEFIKVRASGSIAYNTERMLTNEIYGLDTSGNGQIDPMLHPDEINPNFDARIDQTGRRFRLEQQYIIGVQVTASLNF